jgi:hypothetical protein
LRLKPVQTALASFFVETAQDFIDGLPALALDAGGVETRKHGW